MAGESFGSGGGGTSGGGFGNVGSYYNLGRYVANLFSHPSQIFITNPFQGFEDAFIEGKAKTIDTTQAVLRLGASGNPVVRQFGRDLATLEQGGVVLSTSTGPGRANLNRIFAKASEGLQAQGFTKQHANQLLINVINSHTAASGALIPTHPRGLPGNAVSVRVQPQSEPIPRMIPPSKGQGDLFSNQFVTKAQNLVKDFVPGLREFEDLTGHEIQFPSPQPLIDFFKPPGLVHDMYRQLGDQPQPIPPMNPQQPSQQREIIDPRDCPTCNPQQREQFHDLQQQQRDLQRELQTEKGQQQGKTLDDQRQQIDKLKDLETQPVQSRDIQKEIEQKMGLLNQIGNELAALQHAIDGNPGSPPTNEIEDHTGHDHAMDDGSNPPGQNPPATQPYTPGEVIEPDRGQSTGQLSELEHEQEEQQIFLQQQPVGSGGDPTKAVKFCVGCVTQDDALRFLNGEPSACSVMSFPS